jgi:hypothetical protein
MNFSEGICGKIKKSVLCLNVSFLKIVSFMNNVEKYSACRHTTHDDIIRRMLVK